MNGILAAAILSLASISAAPAPQEFYSHAYHTQSVYPHYNIQYQPFPIQPYPTLFPEPAAYVQPGLPVSPSLSSNSSELQKIEADFQAAVEKIKNQNERNDAAVKPDEKVEAKSSGATIQNSFSALNPFIAAGKTSIGADCLGTTFHSADPIFGPEIGARYEVHYAPEPYFSSYAGFAGQPSAFPAYSDFSAYPSYPAFGAGYPFVGVGNGGAALAPSNENKNDVAPTNLPGPTGISTIEPVQGDAPNLSTAGPEEAPKELSSTAVPNETSSEVDFVGAPPSIDGPGKLSKKKRGQGKNGKKSVN